MNRTATSSALLKAALATLFLLALVHRGLSDPNLSAAQAAQHVGETASVTDKVDAVHQSAKGNIFFNMGGHYPNQAFTAFIPAAAASNFPDARAYEGKTVTVSGKIQLYRGKPEIIVKSKDQIKG